MEIKTFGNLIDWTRQMHLHLAKCLHESAAQNSDERIGALLDYVAEHESTLATTVSEFEKQANPNALNTRIYDYIEHKPPTYNQICDDRYASMGFDDIVRDIFGFHDQILSLYDTLIGKAEIEEAKSLLEDLLALEQHEAKQLASQIGRMNDV
ncbi:MAG: ATPase [Marinobacter sp.]|uniref:ATPase n=1 Tax=Marinobacter sp. TaxID=50741 RepID=UPI003F9B5877